MKKEAVIFILNIFIAIGITGTLVNVSSLYADETALIGSKVLSVCSPVSYVENEKQKIFNKTSKDSQKTDNNITTTSSDSTEVMNRINGKDSNLDSISETPRDIAALMKAAKKSIKTEKVKGKTSEENYQGGGTIVSFGDLEVQSKIPTSFYNLNIESLLKQKAALSISDFAKPTVLIYHSHTTESYTMLDVGYYTKSTDLRSNEANTNMVRVGDDLCAYLEKAGIGVVHDRTIHDEDYNSSYDSSRKTIDKYLEKYPTIEITIDVHRDDITYENKTKVKPTAKINDKKAARMMIIAGCEYNRVKNFPDWEYNLRFDLAVQNKVNKMYPGLMRPILFSERKYNMDETRNSFLLEVGTDANTLDEACYSARLFGSALSELIKEYKE